MYSRIFPLFLVAFGGPALLTGLFYGENEVTNSSPSVATLQAIESNLNQSTPQTVDAGVELELEPVAIDLQNVATQQLNVSQTADESVRDIDSVADSVEVVAEATEGSDEVMLAVEQVIEDPNVAAAMTVNDHQVKSSILVLEGPHTNEFSQVQSVDPYAYESYPSAIQYRPTSHPAMNVDNFTLFDYRRMMKNGQDVHPSELQGKWRGINKGIATVAIDQQFVKHFHHDGNQVRGGNISVHQVPNDQLGINGWQPVAGQEYGVARKEANFLVQTPKRKCCWHKKGVILNYRQGENRKGDPSKLITDELVKLDDNHMLGRATVKLGPIKIPLAYFVLEREVE